MQPCSAVVCRIYGEEKWMAYFLAHREISHLVLVERNMHYLDLPDFELSWVQTLKGILYGFLGGTWVCCMDGQRGITWYFLSSRAEFTELISAHLDPYAPLPSQTSAVRVIKRLTSGQWNVGSSYPIQAWLLKCPTSSSVFFSHSSILMTKGKTLKMIESLEPSLIPD